MVMNEKIHQCLDGAPSRGSLTPGERGELDTYRDVLRETLAGLPSESAPDMTAEVMRRVAELPARAPAGSYRRQGGRVGFLLNLWRPRTITFRPAVAVAVLGALAVGGGILGREAGGRDRDAAAVPVQQGGTAVVVDGSDARVVRVRFRLDAPAASSVSLAGDFTGWEPAVSLIQEAPGVWSVVVPLEPGVHDYAFVIDGSEWVLDPMAQAVSDGFGGQNSRVAILVQEGQS